MSGLSETNRMEPIVTCSHQNQVRLVSTPADQVEGCEECLAQGSTWVHLRQCLTCGHIGCCDHSEHKHARQHFDATQHPIIQTVEPNETWAWCYLDEKYFRQAPLPQ